MIPASFDYARAESLEEAVALLGEHGEDAKLLAGGHSLIPLLRLRFAAPSLLVDVGRVRELAYVREQAGQIAIGALTRYRDLERSELLAAKAPLVRHAAGQVGDPQVRHRGTIGGSVAHGDPAADVPAVLLALDAQLVLHGPAGDRVVAAADFFLGFLETALGPDEVLTEIRVPSAPAGWAFEKFNRRAQDWAIVGCAVVLGAEPRIALVNMASTPVRASAAEQALAQGASIAEAAALAGAAGAPTADLNASAEYRRHLARVLVRRALERAARAPAS